VELMGRDPTNLTKRRYRMWPVPDGRLAGGRTRWVRSA